MKSENTLRRHFMHGVMLLAVALWPAPTEAVHEETVMGEIESRPAPVSRRECVGGANAGALCNENADCPGSSCQDRNVFNLTVSVRFNATAAQLTTIQNAMSGMAASLFDVTDGQAQIGQVTILNNSTGAGGTIWVFSSPPCSGGNFCADSGHWAGGGKISLGIGGLGSAGAGEAIAHEFVHLVFDARDEYEMRAAGCGGVTGSASCPAVGSGEEFCLMDVGGLNGGGTELCWGQADPGDLTDISGGNHDPSNVTEQSRCRSNRSCWDQVGWSWPSTFLVPAGAPDPAAGGAVVDPVVFFQPPANARIVLVLDNSGSMAAEGPPTRLDRLQTAALDFVNLAQNGVELGLVSFSSTATDQVAIAALGADRSDYTDAINGLAPTFATNIGDGLQHARDMITAAGGVTGNTSVVLMTDGINNRPLPDPAGDLQAKIDALLADGVPVYVTCTGDDLGLDSQCAEIAAGTGGTYVDSAQAAMLADAFTDFHELIMGRHPAASFGGSFSKGFQTYKVLVEPGARVATFTLLWRNAGNIAELLVLDPAGTQFRGRPITQGRALLVPDPLAGEWTVGILPEEGSGEFISRAYLENPIVDVTAAMRRAKVEPGEPFVVYALPRFAGPIGIGVQLSGMVTKPDGSTVAINLTDDGRANDSGDDVADDGIYSATLTDTSMTGAYSFHIMAMAVDAKQVGHTRGPEEEPVQVSNFVREVRLSATVNDLPKIGSQICIGSGASEPGTQVTVPIFLTNGNGIAGFQVDVLYNPAVLTPAAVRLGADTPAASGWSVASAAVGVGALRVLGHSNPPAPLGPGFREVALVDFDIAPGAPLGASPFFLRDCVLSDPLGRSIQCHLCQEPGEVVVRNASTFRFRPIPAPVGVDRFDPLPFPVAVEALDSLGNVATGYGGTAGMSIPQPICAGTLMPASLGFSGGVGGPAPFKIACCLDPLLPATTTSLSLRASDPGIMVGGMSDPFQGVAKGDLNADNSVNVLDVTRDVRLALNLPVAVPPPTGFQAWAGNMLDQNCAVDGRIDVLDVVRIRNKVLGRPPLCPCPTGRVAGSVAPSAVADAAAGPVSLSIVKAGPKEYLVMVRGARDLGGLQLELRGVGSKTTVSPGELIAGRGWQLADTLEKGVLRVIVFSNGAAGVTGEGAVLRLTGTGSPKLRQVIASDSEGRALPLE